MFISFCHHEATGGVLYLPAPPWSLARTGGQVAAGLSRPCSCHSAYTGVREGKEDEMTVWTSQLWHTQSDIENCEGWVSPGGHSSGGRALTTKVRGPGSILGGCRFFTVL